MGFALSEYELEALPEMELEASAEGDRESEQFFGLLRKLAGNVGNWAVHQATTKNSPLRKAAFGAAHSVLQNAPKLLGGIGKAAGTGNPSSAALGAALGNALGYALRGMDGAVPQGENEWESELSPVRKWYPDAMLEHLGHAAAEAEAAHEAGALAGAMIPWVARAVPGAYQAIVRSAPGLALGAAGAAHHLWRHPHTRPLVRLLPAAVRGTARQMAQQSASGYAMAPKQAVRTLSRETYRLLSNPQQAAQAFKNAQRMDRLFHGYGTGTTARTQCSRCGSCRAR
jgi:hypothetical protein